MLRDCQEAEKADDFAAALRARGWTGEDARWLAFVSRLPGAPSFFSGAIDALLASEKRSGYDKR